MTYDDGCVDCMNRWFSNPSIPLCPSCRERIARSYFADHGDEFTFEHQVALDMLCMLEAKAPLSDVQAETLRFIRLALDRALEQGVSSFRLSETVLGHLAGDRRGP